MSCASTCATSAFGRRLGDFCDHFVRRIRYKSESKAMPTCLFYNVLRGSHEHESQEYCKDFEGKVLTPIAGASEVTHLISLIDAHSDSSIFQISS